MTDQERLEIASKRALALANALDHLAGVCSSFGPDDMFEVIATQIMNVNMNNGIDTSTYDLIKITNRIKTYFDLVGILQIIFSGFVNVEWDQDDSILRFSLSDKGMAKADEILKKIGAVSDEKERETSVQKVPRDH